MNPFGSPTDMNHADHMNHANPSTMPVDHSHHHHHTMATPTTGGHDHGGGGVDEGHGEHGGMVSGSYDKSIVVVHSFKRH